MGKPEVVSDFKEFKRSGIKRYKRRSNIKSVRLEKISHDEDYKKLMKDKKTFSIDNPEFLQNDKRTLNGIFSPLFGPDMMNPDSHVYTCECKELIGAVNEGKICPECGTMVQYINPDLRNRAFIDIAPYHIITYHGWIALKKIIKNLDEIITTSKKIDLKGKVVPDGKMDLIELYERYDDDFYPLTGVDKKIVFTSKIPMYSAILRPLIRGSGVTLTIFDVNKDYNSIVKLSRDLQTFKHIESVTQTAKILNQIQQNFNKILVHIDGLMKSKNGIFRRYIASGRVDYSSRMVITPGTDLEPHEIDLPYTTFMELYEEEIVNMLTKIEGISISKALGMFKRSLNTVDEKFMNIINMLLKSKKNGIWGLINRNPSIKYGSILFVRIRKIHTDINDTTMKLPTDILNLLGADYDGDQLTYIAVKDTKFYDVFMHTFCPTYLFVDRATGYFNTAMGFKKDYAAILSSIWDISKKVSEYMVSPDEDIADMLKNIGILDADVDSKNAYKVIDNMVEDGML